MSSPLPRFSAAIVLLAGFAAAGSDYPVRPVPFTEVRFTGGVWQQRQEINTRVTLPFALGQLESSGRLKNFDLAADTMKRRAAGEKNFQHQPPTQYPFDDSDVYKCLEGAAYSLGIRPDPALEAKLDGIIARIAAAQEADGYLYTFRTMHPDSPGHGWIGRQRWEKDPELSHEFYNIGHLYEAGVAHARATGKKNLLDVCLKSAELVHRDFGDGEPKISPGHQVIEMGMAQLFRLTGDRRWIELTRHFVETRGHRGNTYSQDHLPPLEQKEAVGHAVRANYLYSGMADLAALTGDARYTAAITGLWENVVGKKLHITGGCGALAAGEAYGAEYELPNRCYNETCAAIAFLFWTHRMFLLTGDGKYMDVFERTLHNGFLSGVSLSGDRFFYPNPLEYDGREPNNHGHAGRAPWFGCACCPPNTLRLLASLGGYQLATRDRRLFVNLYAASRGTAMVGGEKVTLEQTTAYPWEGSIQFVVRIARPARFDLALRHPGWNRGRPLPTDLYRYTDPAPAGWKITVNGQVVDAPLENGYRILDREWKDGDTVTFDLEMPVRQTLGHEAIAATRGLVSVERGPVVYCFEGIDNEGSVFDLMLPEGITPVADFRADLLGGIPALVFDGPVRARRAAGQITGVSAKVTGIPYAWWNNRGNSPMTVWLPRNAADTRPPPVPTLATRSALKTSFARGGMDPERLRDQLMPRNFTDSFAPNFDFWPHKGGTEWIEYIFPDETEVTSVTLSWFDDTGRGECRLPASWRLLAADGQGGWKPIPITGKTETRKSKPSTHQVPPTRTTALRLEITQPEGFATGLYEWQVNWTAETKDTP